MTWHRRLVAFALSEQERLAAHEARVDELYRQVREDAEVRGEPEHHEFDKLRLRARARRQAEQEESPNALARRCPGEFAMFIVDIPGVGRVWPAGVARQHLPMMYDLDLFEPGRLGHRAMTPHAIAVAVAAGALVVGMVWALAGAIAAVSVPFLFGSLWLLLGGAPVNGPYAHRPDCAELAAVASRPAAR